VPIVTAISQANANAAQPETRPHLVITCPERPTVSRARCGTTALLTRQVINCSQRRQPRGKTSRRIKIHRAGRPIATSNAVTTERIFRVLKGFIHIEYPAPTQAWPPVSPERAAADLPPRPQNAPAICERSAQEPRARIPLGVFNIRPQCFPASSLAAAILHDEAGVLMVFDGPWRWEAAGHIVAVVGILFSFDAVVMRL
jgi:hypothetical protein